MFVNVWRVVQLLDNAWTCFTLVSMHYMHTTKILSHYYMNLHGLVVTAVFLPQEVSAGNLILFRLLRLMRLLRLVKLLQVLRRFRRKDGTNPGVFGTIPVAAVTLAANWPGTCGLWCKD